MTRTLPTVASLAILSLTFAVGTAVAAPTVTAPLPDLVVYKNSAPSNIPLGTRFNDANVSVVRFTIANFGTVDVALFDVAKPITTNNFKAYMNAGRYNNVIIHRSAVYSADPFIPFVLQGGGFTTPTGNNVPPGTVQSFAPIQNEPGISNRRGTIAMAKLGGNPNSATSEWFFNMNNDNGSTPGYANLDTQNGGFTVFGRVIGSAGLTVLDNIIGFNTYNLTTFYGNSALDDCPLPGYQGGSIVRPTDFVNVTTVAPNPTPTSKGIVFTATSSNPALVTPSIVNDTLRLTYTANASGSAIITVTATSADTSTVTDTLVSHVRCSSVDIADDQGTPLPSSSVNNGITEGDYNAFFAGFFDALAYCDVADDQGNPIPNNLIDIPNNGVTEGDYNCFFRFFFDGC